MKKYTIEKLSESPALRLELYEWMLGEWKKPLGFTTTLGFCHQLYCELQLKLFKDNSFKKTLPELFNCRVKNENIRRAYHYPYAGDHLQGRLDRQKALEKAIEEVK